MAEHSQTGFGDVVAPVANYAHVKWARLSVLERLAVISGGISLALAGAVEVLTTLSVQHGTVDMVGFAALGFFALFALFLALDV